MPKRGGYRPNAGRPRGAKTKRPFGNLPSSPPALPPAPEEIVQAVTVHERRSWKRANQELVSQKAEQWLQELERRALDEKDNRLAFEIYRLRIAYAHGLPTAEPPETDVGRLIQRIHEELMVEQAQQSAALAQAPPQIQKEIRQGASKPEMAPDASPERSPAQRPPDAPAPVLGETHYLDRSGRLVEIERPEVKNPIERRFLGLREVPVLNERGEVAKSADTSPWVKPGDDW